MLSPNCCLLEDLEVSSSDSDDNGIDGNLARCFKRRTSYDEDNRGIKRQRATNEPLSMPFIPSSSHRRWCNSDCSTMCSSDSSSDSEAGEEELPDEQMSTNDEDEEFDPDDHIKPGSSSWGLLMEMKQTPECNTHRSSLLQKLDSSPENKSHTFSTDNNIPARVMSLLTSLFEKDNFQFSQSVSFLHIIRKQVAEAMSSAFSTMLSSSGIRMPVPHQQPHPSKSVSASVISSTMDSEDVAFMRKVAKALSDIAASSNPENGFRPAASVFRQFIKANPSSGKNYPLAQVCSKVIFYREIHSVIAMYLSLVYIQRVMNNNNTNSSGYSEGMVTKMFNILDKIPHDEMSRDKYVSVGRDALYLYQNIITDVTGPKHSKRLRTPQQQVDFCYVIAMLVNDAPIASDSTFAGKATNLVQFASAMGDPAYRLAVHKMACVFNSSYSVYKVLNLDRSKLMLADLILSVLSVRNKSLSERKPRTLTQSVFLFLQPELRDLLRSSGLTSEESSLGTAVKLASQQLQYEGVTLSSLEDGCRIMCGNYISPDGYNLKCLGSGEKDVKTVGLATLLTDRFRTRVSQQRPYY